MIAVAGRLVTLSPRDNRDLLAELVDRLRQPEIAIHERVLRELYPDVEAWAFRRLGPCADLEDAVQDTLSEIAKALYRFEGRSSLRTLAYRITSRTVSRHRKKRRRVPRPTEDIEITEPRPSPEETVASRHRAAKLLRLLDELPPTQREAFIACVVDERTPQEAAELIGCAPGALRVRLHRARQNLRAMLEREER